jgi:hypothetical protein
MGVGRCLGLEVLEEGGFGASQEGWLLVVMLLIIIFYFAILLFCQEEEEEEPYLLKLHVLYVSSWSLFVPLYPTYRSCFKEFRPPIFLRISYL